MPSPKPALEERLAARLRPRFAVLPAPARQTRRRALILGGGFVSLAAGIACAIALALFLMGLSNSRTHAQSVAVWTTGAFCLGCGLASWGAWLLNRIGRLLGS